MLISRLDDKRYLVTPEIFGSNDDSVFVIVSMTLEIQELNTENVSVIVTAPEHTFLIGKKRTYHLAGSTIAQQAF